MHPQDKDDEEKGMMAQGSRAQLSVPGVVREESHSLTPSTIATRMTYDDDDVDRSKKHARSSNDGNPTGSFDDGSTVTSSTAARMETDADTEDEEGRYQDDELLFVDKDKHKAKLLEERATGPGAFGVSEPFVMKKNDGPTPGGPEQVPELGAGVDNHAIPPLVSRQEMLEDALNTKITSAELSLNLQPEERNMERITSVETPAMTRRQRQALRRAERDFRQADRLNQVAAAAAAEQEAAVNTETIIANSAGVYGIPPEPQAPPSQARQPSTERQIDEASQHDDQFQNLQLASVRIFTDAATNAQVVEDPNAPLVPATAVDDNDIPTTQTDNTTLASSQDNKTRACPRYILLFVLVVLVVVVIVVVALVMKPEEKEGTPHIPMPTPPPTSALTSPVPSFTPSMAPTRDIQPLKTILQRASPNPSLLDRTSSVQTQAMEWLYEPYLSDDEENEARMMLESYEPWKLVQRHAIVVFYLSTQGSNADHEWKNEQGWMQAQLDECTWFGITCNSNVFYNGTIVKMDLPKNNLRGNLPDEIGLLSRLSSLVLSNNAIKGPLPNISTLSSLEFLDIANNNLEGDFPSQIGKMKSLKVIDLRNNNELRGSIPESIGDLQHLEKIILFNNQHSGILPSSLRRLSNLNELSLYSNRMNGTVPSFLGSLSQLGVLGLSANQFKGTVPSALGNLMSLTDLFLDDNGLTGSLPSTFGNLVSLVHFDVSENRLNGTLPTEMGRMGSLQTFEIFSNKFRGKFPETFGDWQNLVCMNVETNLFTGQIPDSLGSIQSLQRMDVSNNSFTGSMPESICDLGLTRLDADCRGTKPELSCANCCTQCKDDASSGNAGKTQCTDQF